MEVEAAIHSSHPSATKASRIWNGTFPSVLKFWAMYHLRAENNDDKVSVFQGRWLGISLPDLPKDSRIYLMTLNPYCLPTSEIRNSQRPRGEWAGSCPHSRNGVFPPLCCERDSRTPGEGGTSLPLPTWMFTEWGCSGPGASVDP